jgi:hypothetical protein
MTLTELVTSARTMGYRADIVGTGGNVVALSVTFHGDDVLISLGDGVHESDSWSVSTDGATRDRVGYWESADLPISSDADQIIGDAHAWALHVVWGYSFGSSEDEHHGYECGCLDA